MNSDKSVYSKRGTAFAIMCVITIVTVGCMNAILTDYTNTSHVISVMSVLLTFVMCSCAIYMYQWNVLEIFMSISVSPHALFLVSFLLVSAPHG